MNNSNTDKIFNLYKKSIPGIVRDDDTVKEILSDKNNHILYHMEKNTLAGVSVIHNNSIYLLCVDTSFQKKGIGKKLLAQSEAHICGNGFVTVKTGAGETYIMPGIPMNRNAHLFFKKFGYEHAWGSSGCFDMSQDLSRYRFTEFSFGDEVNGITYRWANENDRTAIMHCVTAAWKEFAAYYQDTDAPVLIAAIGNEVVGTLMIGIEMDGKGIGSVGCTTTHPAHQGKGIATNMVKLGTKHLKDIGLEKGFLGYTYTEIVKMYGRAGYEVCMEYYMGEKFL